MSSARVGVTRWTLRPPRARPDPLQHVVPKPARATTAPVGHSGRSPRLSPAFLLCAQPTPGSQVVSAAIWYLRWLRGSLLEDPLSRRKSPGSKNSPSALAERPDAMTQPPP